ncbi:hypothetical protein ACIRVF_04345 [Kitasatospora sp. NPDC101157]
MAHLVDAGVLRPTAVRGPGPVNAADPRAAHRLQESGTAVGRTSLTGF